MNRWHITVRSVLLLGVTFFTPLISFAQSPVPDNEFSLENAPAALQDQSLYQQINPLPQVYVTNLGVTADDKNVITGSFEATSGEGAAVANLQYELQILQALPLEADNALVDDDGVVYDRYLFPETFALDQRGSQKISFSFDAAALPAGSYRTRIQLSQTNDRSLGWGDAAVTLNGERPFVVITTDGVTVESTDPVTQEQKSDWEPKEGPNVTAGQTITIKATASTIGAADITGKPIIAVERILSTQRTVLTQEFDAITIPVGEDHALSLPLITETTPGAYRVLLSFHNNEGKRVSGIGEFRYVVAGPSASIVSQLVKELPVRQGSTATVDFTVAGAADRVQNITGTLEVIVSDDQGIIGQAENVLAINGATPAQGTAAVVLQRDRCGVPKITLIAKNQDGTELDRYEAAYPNFTANCSTLLQWSRPLWLALGAIAILILAALYFILRRRHRTPAPPNPMSGTIALVIIGIVLLGTGIALSLWGSSSAQANGIQYIAVSFQDPTHQLTRPTLYVASPVHTTNVTSSSVYYSARFTWLNCDNNPAKGFLRVYAKTDGGQVNWSAGHNWVELAKNTLNLPPQCWRCPAKPKREVALSGTLQVPALTPGGSNTLWSYGDNTGSWIGGSIVQDFTWLNFPAAPPPPPLTSSLCTPTPAQAPTFTFSTAWKIREFINSFPQYTDIQAYPDVGSGAARFDDATALKVCQLKGYQNVTSKNSSFYYSCWDNTVGHWDHTQQNFVIANACSTGGKYLWSITCSNPSAATQCAPTPSAQTPACPLLPTITFDTLPNGSAVSGVPTTSNTFTGTSITNQYSSLGATFSSNGAAANATHFSDLGTAQSNFLVGNNGGSGFANSYYPLEITITTPGGAERVGVTLVSVGSAGLSAKAYNQAGTLVSQLSRTGTGTGGLTREPVALTGAGITRVTFERNVTTVPHEDGFAIDDVQITRPASACASPTPTTPQCSDTIDNDGDGKVDRDDPGCHTDGNANNAASYDPNDNTELDNAPQCSDHSDNDGDGRIDAADPGCHTDGKANNPASYDPNDNTETDSIPQCRDGIDNDGDGKIDTTDAGCHADADANNAASYNPDDTDETNTHCSDSKDNDGDSRTDSADPGCHTDRDATNTSTYKPSLTTEADQACSDNKDNDGDGKVDRNDPGCRTSPSDPNTYNPNDNNETDPGVSPGPIQETE